MNGMTLRQYAAIKLKVPKSGTDWLDEMILASLRYELAGQALAAVGDMMRDNTPLYPESVVTAAYAIADAMLKARGEP